MILEQIVVKILQEEMPKAFSRIQWDGMYNKTAERIVKAVKDEIVRYE